MEFNDLFDSEIGLQEHSEKAIDIYQTSDELEFSNLTKQSTLRKYKKRRKV